MEAYPLQVNAIARGMLPDSGCTILSGVNQARTVNMFTIVMTTKTNPLAVCTQMLMSFERSP